MAAKTKISKITKLVEELFSLLGIKASFEIDYQEGKKDDPDNVLIDIKVEGNPGLLIGKRGETLSSLQSFLGIAISRGQDKWVRVSLNVGDWKERQEDYLKNLAYQAAERAKETSEPQNLYNLTPVQRRIVHMALAEDKEVTTESQGEGEGRYLVVKAK